jgi:hypothetical protein
MSAPGKNDLRPERRRPLCRRVQGTAEGEALAISIPRSETAGIRYFQRRMLYGLFVQDDAE